MPLSAHSPTSTNSKAGSDDNSSMSEAALRKKKNADAQAAFRARRANYIATLEETVTNLEAVVLQLQDSCREAKQEASDLRAENVRLRHEGRDREKFWRALWQARKTGEAPDALDDFPAPSYSPTHTPPSTAVPPPMTSAHPGHYADEGALRFSAGGDPSSSLPNYHPTQDYPQRSPALGYAAVEPDTAGDNRVQHLDPHRMPRYAQYPSYPMDASSRDPTWGNGPNALDSSGSCPSPSYVESPNLTSANLSYPSRFTVVEDQKLPLTPIDTSSYMFSTSRSLSPASTPTSTSSTSLAPAPYPFTFPEGSVVQDRPEFGFRRQTNHVPELTLHGGTADIPIAVGSDALRYRLGHRGATSMPERPVAPAISPYSRTDSGSHDRESDDSESAPYHYTTRARQRHSTTTSRTSRSPSPGPTPICGTLAVIKAQAFGALRRARTRSKRSSEGAAKAAVEALEARGIGMGIGAGSATKRPRLHVDDDMQT